MRRMPAGYGRALAPSPLRRSLQPLQTLLQLLLPQFLQGGIRAPGDDRQLDTQRAAHREDLANTDFQHLSGLDAGDGGAAHAQRVRQLRLGQASLLAGGPEGGADLVHIHASYIVHFGAGSQ